MQTPWGDLAICDAHVHFFSDGFFQLLARQRAGLTVESMGEILGWNMPPPDPLEFASRWIEELDRHGVDRVALIASLPGDESSVERAVAAHPDRFYGFFIVNPLLPDAAVKTKQKLSGGRLRVPCLFPAMHNFSLHDAAVSALLDSIANTPQPVVFVHCGVLSVGVRKKLGLPSPFDLRFSNPLDLHGVALQYPNVRFIIPHFGAGFFRETLMVADLCPNVLLDTSSSNSWIQFEPGLTLESVFRQALRVAGPARLLFGTDSSFFPRGWHSAIFSTQVDMCRQLGIAQGDAQAIFGGNLNQLLKPRA